MYLHFKWWQIFCSYCSDYCFCQFICTTILRKDVNEILIEVLRILAIIVCFGAPAYVMFKYPDDPEW